MQSSTNCNSTSNQNNCNNNNKQNNNDQNENNENENNENDNNNGSNSTGGSGNGGSGNGGKKHNNNNDDDKDKKNEDEEEDKDDEKQVKLVKKRFSDLTPCLCLDGAQKTVSLTEYPFRYTPIGLERVVGRIKISKEITQITIPNIIRENITNIYFFIDQMIAIAIYDKQYYDNGQIRILNPGFHDESGHSLYCVVEKIDTPRNIRLSYEMKNKLFTTKNLLNEFCKYNLHEHDLPVNTSDMIVSMVNVEKMKNKLADHAAFCTNIIFKTKWHRQHVFGRKNNKQRHTFSIVKNEFISIVQEQIYKQKCPVVIPIIMFHSSGYRIEYIHIVKLKENISIGISYIDNKHCKYGIKVTGIHLDKNNIFHQHQMVLPNHNCNCLDTFISEIDFLHIGNADDDKNRYNAAKNENSLLKIELQDLTQDNRQFKDTIVHLNHEVGQLNDEIGCLSQDLSALKNENKQLQLVNKQLQLANIPLLINRRISISDASSNTYTPSYSNTYTSNLITPQSNVTDGSASTFGVYVNNLFSNNNGIIPYYNPYVNNNNSSNCTNNNNNTPYTQ